MSKELFDMIDRLIINLMGETKIPGLAIGIVKDGEPFYTKGFGARNLEKNLPFTPDTLFGIGSISKSFTALSINQLAEQGKIDLHEPVRKYINFKLGKRKNPITIHHLLSHSSGIPELHATILTLIRSLGSLDSIIPMSSWDDFLLHINGAEKEIFDEPGKCYFYNNDAFACLGLIIEEVTNMKFEDYIRKNILNPLEMKRSTYLKIDYEKDNNVMTGYLPSDDDKPLRATPPPFDKIMYPAGGLLSSVREMQNYIIALLNKGKFKDKQIIQKSSLDKIWTPHTKLPAGTSYGEGDAWYCYGWTLEKDFFEQTLIHHGGNALTSSGFLAIHPVEKMGIIIGVNCSIQVVLGVIVRGLLALLLGKDINQAIPIINAQRKLSLLTGKYAIYKGLQTLEILLENGILFLKIKYPLTSKPLIVSLACENLEELKFYVPFAIPNQKINVQFLIDKKGKVHLLIDRYYFHKL